jgi:hypothetical protein
MIRQMSLFGQLLNEFSRSAFVSLVRKHQTERCAKGFSSWSHFVSMLFCQLAQAKSLREICDGLRCCLGKLVHIGMQDGPRRSTLAYANQHRRWELFQDLFFEMLPRCQQVAPHKKFPFKNKMLSIDASTFDLCLSLFPWAKFYQTKGAVKLHLLLDHDGYLPVYACIREAAVHEINIARILDLPPDSIIAMDRGFTDYSLYHSWTERKIWFVTPQRSHARYQVIEQRPVVASKNVLSDEIITWTNFYSQRDCPVPLRRIVVWDPEKEEEIVLLTNHLDFAASTIAAIYKDRWQIEIFFKTLKQNLKVKTFVGTSENALKIQIWTALIAMLLIKYLKFRATLSWSMSNLIALLRLNLFTYRDLWEWINHPFNTPPLEPQPVQMALPISGLGQHLVK